MRTEAELREQIQKFEVQALAYRRRQDGIEAYACSLICSVLSYACGDTAQPTTLFNLTKRKQ